MAGQDDGSRVAAVGELGEDAVRAAEVEVVKANAPRLSVATFIAMGISPASILEGLGLDAEAAPLRPALIPPRGRPSQAQPRGSQSSGPLDSWTGVGR